ncbi:MAG TPA: ABC transporter permease [Chryseosolibacter sp.]|nr:ABC transporter permease [Chryseosolibacter sp.]
MFRNYLKIAFRSLLKFKEFTAINLLGLALGLTAGLMIMMYVLDELSYDQFHTRKDRIYRVETAFHTGDEEGTGTNDANGWGVGAALKNFPEVEAVMYARGASGLLINHDGKKIRQQMHFATPEFFQIFSFELLKGNTAKVLVEPYSIVITEDMEKKYFDGNGLNKTLTVQDTLDLVVTGVMKNIPSNSHIQLDALISFSTFTTAIYPAFDFNGGWGNINVRNYVLLKEGADFQSFSKKASDIYVQHAGEALKNWGVEARVHFAPLTDLYLTSKSGNGMGPVGSLDRVYLMSGIALFVILLACINFINLSTARSVYRAKEVGLRKVAGSNRFSLIKQFLSESLLVTICAVFVALAFVGVLLPIFNSIIGKSYTMRALLSPEMIGGALVLIVAITLLAGYYPAVLMSGLKPAEVLKGKMQTSSRGVRLRRTLVVFQFVISATLVLGTQVVIDQLRFMQQQDLGFAKDQIVVINAARVSSPNPDAHETFKNELKALAFVEDVTFSNSLPGNPGWTGQVSFPEGRPADEAVSVEYMAIDENYLQTLGLTLLSGKDFSMVSEGDRQQGLLLNETAVAAYGWESPEQAIGKKIQSPSGYPAGQVIGVVKDYHQLGLQQNIGPMVMDLNPRASYLYAVRYKAANTADLIQALGEKWGTHFPGFEFNYFFLDQDFEKQYQAEQRLVIVFGIFSVVTILIAVIGLLGLVSFMVVSRTKEIGVRKVLGAGVIHIASILSKEFVRLVVIANLLAFPLVWYLANEWLQNFANRVSVSPWIFVITLLAGVVITFLSISFQTVKAAMADPVKSLRYE